MSATFVSRKDDGRLGVLNYWIEHKHLNNLLLCNNSGNHLFLHNKSHNHPHFHNNGVLQDNLNSKLISHHNLILQHLYLKLYHP